ncbi:hypothetical protein yc1106_04085 [Curvularia clavata]|uniref:Uncharacterized protein n=1 Tax=Curvularia clavata TaxID=95742 RepID=A0A9Q8Z5P2_CURCL|nr:hypothetical protein yc1106_04085 [Curvularia clavata]
MTSSGNYELPPYQGEAYFAPSISPLHSPHRQERNVSNHDHSTETLMTWNEANVDSAPGKEQINVQCREHEPKRSRRLHFRDWYWEIVAAVFSLACVIAIIVLLKTYQEKSLSRWRFYHDITLNTLVALLSTLSRTALIVPVASCISQLKWVHLMSSPRPLRDFQILDEASRGPWGSLTLIWRLHFKTKLATWGALITIASLTMGPLSQQLLSYPSRSHYETSGATFYRNQIYDSGAGSGPIATLVKQMDPRMQGAILNGLYNLSAPIQVECLTGNCEWDDITTLAVASECKNVTSSTAITCDTSPESRVCNYTTPSGFLIESRVDFGADGSSATQFNSTAGEGPPISQFGRVLNSTLLQFAAARMTAPYSDEAPDVTECSLRWVARQLQNTSVVNGTFHPGTITDFELVGIENSFDPTSWVTFGLANDSASTFPGNSTFSVLPSDNGRVGQFLSSVFSSSIDDTFGLALNNATNLTQVMQRISDSMSYALGQSPSGIKVSGRTITPEQYIHVKWEWIILPITEVAMGIAFLAATLLQSWRKGVVAWKSSAIVPLLTEMEESWRTGESGVQSTREVEKRVKDMTGVLESNEGGRQIFRRIK